MKLSNPHERAGAWGEQREERKRKKAMVGGGGMCKVIGDEYVHLSSSYCRLN